MALTKLNDTAFHEAGHCLISYLAPDLFEINFITVNLEHNKLQNANSLVGLRGSLKKKIETLTFEENDLMVLIYYAGMAADDVNHCNCQLTQQLYDNFVFAQKMNSNKYSGDAILSMPHLQKIIPALSIEQRQYTISCQRLLHEIFINKTITPILIELRNEISNFTDTDKALSSKEIIDFLEKTELKNWRENEWKEIMISRIAEIKKTTNNIIKSNARLSFWQKLFSNK